MRALSQTGARHFCGTFSGNASLDMDDFVGGTLKGKRAFAESSATYSIYRDTLVRESERAFFLSVACFRRAHDLFVASAAFWAHVTLYYSNWFAAHCLLGLFGCWADRVQVEVMKDTPGQQEFVVTQAPKNKAPHKAFWDAYYDALAPLQNWIDPALNLAVDPINKDMNWQTKVRNRVNYRVREAMDLVSTFDQQFDPTRFPASVPGETGTQYEVTKSTIMLAAQVLVSHSVATDAFAALQATRAMSVEQLVYLASIPSLGGFAQRAALAV